MLEIQQFFKHFQNDWFIHITCSKFESRVKDQTEIEVNENDQKQEIEWWEKLTKEKEDEWKQEKEFWDQLTAKAFEYYKDWRK